MVRSRLSKKKQQQMVRQTFLYGFLAIAILTIFVFLVIPWFIRFADQAFGGSIGEAKDKIPPQTPILAAPLVATNSATLSVSGAGEAGSKAILVLNSEEFDEVKIDENGEFGFDVPLEEGENLLAVYSVDQAENESVKTREYSVQLDTAAPVLEIEEPTDGSTIELRKNQVVTIKGSTEPQAKIFINDRLVYARSDGSFSMSHQLAEGENIIKFKVQDKGGNVSEKELTVSFRY